MKHYKDLILIAISAAKFRKLLEESSLRKRDVHYLAPMLKKPTDLKGLVQPNSGGSSNEDTWADAEV